MRATGAHIELLLDEAETAEVCVHAYESLHSCRHTQNVNKALPFVVILHFIRVVIYCSVQDESSVILSMKKCYIYYYDIWHILIC